jgi:hypothetical protein
MMKSEFQGEITRLAPTVRKKMMALLGRAAFTPGQATAPPRILRCS